MTSFTVPNLFVTRPFKAGREKNRRVETLRRGSKSRMDDLQEGDCRPVWQEFKDASDTMGVEMSKGTVTEPTKVVSRN